VPHQSPYGDQKVERFARRSRLCVDHPLDVDLPQRGNTLIPVLLAKPLEDAPPGPAGAVGKAHHE
jgi:hypothetical protein